MARKREGFDFENVPSLSNEVREKLLKIRPKTLGQASRISGVTPAAISILQIFLAKYRSESDPEGIGMTEDLFDGASRTRQI